MPSAADLITDSLRELNVIGATETPEAPQLARGFTVLNRMVSAWGTRRLTIFAVGRAVQPLTANLGDYTIGPGGAFNQARPLWIRFGVIPNRNAAPPVLEIPLGDSLSDDEYQAIAFKGQTASYPWRGYYDRSWTGVGVARVKVWPIPDNSNCDLVLYTPTAMGRFADLSTIYLLPDGYEEAIHYNLTLRLAGAGFGAVVSPDVRMFARQSLADIEHANVRIGEVNFDRGLVQGSNGRGDIRTNYRGLGGR